MFEKHCDSIQAISSTGASKNSQSIFWSKLLLLRSEVDILFQRWARLHI